jgi:hypothetical protein
MAEPRTSGGPVRTSRELSGRVEQEFHQRSDPFRWWIRALSAAACVAVVVWIGAAAATGRRTIYEAGPVTAPHRFFENDCEACHTTWAPATRLRFVAGDLRQVHSVDNAKCETCHAGSPHFVGQDPPHEGLSCAACHREHGDAASLALAGDPQCVACHGSHDAPTPENGARIALASITSFAGDHPEFDVLQQRDAAQLAFNHSVHLQHEYDESGMLVKGIHNERGELEDLSKNCTVCHEPDAQRQGMLPIRYADHCQRCHPLLFDNQRFPRETVPHGVDTATLRGFLIERYTSLALGDDAASESPAPVRPLPGRRLTANERRSVNGYAAAADQRLIEPAADGEDAARQSALERGDLVFGPHAAGGCRLCHAIDVSESDDPRGFLTQWAIAPPNVPDRWMKRSKFSHDSHRFVSCASCHKDWSGAADPREVVDSTLTSDVLMPGIAVCRSCHGQDAHVFLNQDEPVDGPGVGSRCVDCHAYHRRDGESMSGAVRFDLPSRGREAEDGS